MDEVVRPGSIEITTTFVDMDGAPINPGNAFLCIAYSHDGVPVIDQVAMTLDSSDGTTWRAFWASAPADDGTCCWHILTNGALPGATQGRFKVIANPAAPAPTAAAARTALAPDPAAAGVQQYSSPPRPLRARWVRLRPGEPVGSA